ncbi:MAG: amylo-alpha-1,6-glucosidase [Gemmatimonadaceae bacterium]
MRPILAALILAVGIPATAPSQTIAPFDLGRSAIALTGDARPGQFVSAVGRRAIAMGTEDGAFEVWNWPYKWMHDFRLSFRVPKYTQPIAGRDVARSVLVRPEGVTITYAYETFTVKQTVFTPLDLSAVVMLLEVDAIRPMEIIASFTPDLHLAWPASMGGQYLTWRPDAKAFLFSESRRKVSAFLGSPAVTQASDVPAHQLTAAPPQFTIGVGSAAERYTEPTLGEPPGGNVNIHTAFIPIVLAGGEMPRDSALALYRRLLEPGAIEHEWKRRVAHADSIRTQQVSVRTGDADLDLAVEWAKVNLDESMVCNPDLGCGLVAGYGLSGAASDRPGFGWFFGGDASINSFAMSAVGQHDLVRDGVLTFFAKYQRADGKITHEISQGAGKVDWFGAYPYAFYHGDTTPFWILAFGEYWKQTADTTTVRALWPNVKKAYEWSRNCDTDSDGLMENTCAGAGALEVGDLQEGIVSDVYLNGVWAASLERFARMAEAMGEPALASEARAERTRTITALDGKLWIPAKGQYAFAVLEQGKINETMTAWPATAMAFDVFDKTKGRQMAERMARSDLMTDWGARPLSTTSKLFDPLHYNNGAVWGFVTGWVSTAQFRYGNPNAGWQALRATAQTTFDESRGRNPEVISGRVYKPLDTAVPQQFFATSMILTPLLRGMMGLEVDAPAGTLTVAPWVPLGEDGVRVDRLWVGRTQVDLRVTVRSRDVTLDVTRAGGETDRLLKVTFNPVAGARPVYGELRAGQKTLHLETVRSTAPEVRFAVKPAIIGERSRNVRVVSLRTEGEKVRLVIEGIAGDTAIGFVRGTRGVEGAPDVLYAPPGTNWMNVRTQQAWGSLVDRLLSAGAVPVLIPLPRDGADADGYVRRELVLKSR